MYLSHYLEVEGSTLAHVKSFYILIVRGLSPSSPCPVYMDFSGSPLKFPSGSPLTPCTLAVYMDFQKPISFPESGLKVLVQSH